MLLAVRKQCLPESASGGTTRRNGPIGTWRLAVRPSDCEQERRFQMERVIALFVGILAWAAVGGIAVSVVNAWQDENQVLAFLPIAAAVIVAWAIGEVVTDRVFETQEAVSDGAA